MHTDLQTLFSLRNADGRARLCILVSECLKAVYTALTTAVFLTGFLMCSGLDSVEIGYITALPLISGVLYPFSPLLLEKFRKRKALLGGFRFAYHFFTIFGITVLPLVWRGPGLVQVLMICMLLGSAANTLVASGFPAWHITFLPEEIRGSFFAQQCVYCVGGIGCQHLIRFCSIQRESVVLAGCYSYGGFYTGVA